METRKLIRLGSTTLVVSLPSSWARRMGLSPGSTVTVEERGDELVIRVPSEAAGRKPLTLDADKIPSPVILGKLPSCFYVLGLEDVLIRGELGEKQLYSLRLSASRLGGLEVVEEDEGVHVRTLLDVSRISPKAALRQMSITISKIADTAVRILRGERVDPGLLRLHGLDLFRIQHIVIKCLITGSPLSGEKRRSMVYLIAASLTGLLGDYLASIAVDAYSARSRGEMVGGDMAERLADLVEAIGALAVSVMSSLILSSRKRTLENLERIGRLKGELASMEKQGQPWVSRNIARLEDGLRILEIVNNMAVCNLLLEEK